MSFQFRTFGDMLVMLANSVKAPARMTVSEAATKFRYLREATHTGYWDNSIAPYLVEVMDEMGSLDFEAVAFAGPARCGKTDIFFNFLGYCENCDPGEMMVVHMTQTAARDWSQGDLRKAFRHSKKIGNRVVPGKQNLNTHDVRFISGARLRIKWPTITELSAKTLRRGWATDLDRMPLDVDKEGPVFDLLLKRTQTAGRNGMTVVESSPGFEVKNHRWMPTTAHEAPPTEGILGVYNRGDRRRYYWRCAKCVTPFEGDFKHLKWETHYADGTPMTNAQSASTVVLVCPHCEHPHTHDPDPDDPLQPGKVGLNLAGRWLKDGQRWKRDGTISGAGNESTIASFWLKGVAAAFINWKSLVTKYLNAMQEYERTGDIGPLKTTITTDQGNPFLPPALLSDRTPDDLKSRASKNEWGTMEEVMIPDGCVYTTATIDVQKGSFQVQVHGHGANRDRYVIDRFSIRKSERLDEDGERYPLRPGAYEEDWHLLVEQVIEKTYPLSDGSGRRMRIKAIGCDSGGEEGVTVNAYEFWRWLRDEHPAQHHQRFQLVKGDPNPNAPRYRISYPDTERKDRRAGARGEVPVLMLNVNMLKDHADGLLERQGKAGEIHFSKFLSDKFFQELTVEVKVPNKGWQNPKRLRNESWDLLVYDIGICLVPRLVGEESLDPEDMPSWAQDWDVNDLVFSPETNPRPFDHDEKDNVVDITALAKRFAS